MRVLFTPVLLQSKAVQEREIRSISEHQKDMNTLKRMTSGMNVKFSIPSVSIQANDTDELIHSGCSVAWLTIQALEHNLWDEKIRYVCIYSTTKLVQLGGAFLDGHLPEKRTPDVLDFVLSRIRQGNKLKC